MVGTNQSPLATIQQPGGAGTRTRVYENFNVNQRDSNFNIKELSSLHPRDSKEGRRARLRRPDAKICATMTHDTDGVEVAISPGPSPASDARSTSMAMAPDGSSQPGSGGFPRLANTILATHNCVEGATQTPCMSNSALRSGSGTVTT